MREYNIVTSPISFLAILEMRKEEEINRHGIMTVTGYISDDSEEKYLRLLTGEVWEKIELMGETGDMDILYWGVVTDFSIERINDQKKLTLEITTGSCLLDRKKHLRSFQDKNITYKQIFRQCCQDYENTAVIFSSPFEDKTGQLVLQYEETDWEFLKRLSSRKNKFLVPESRRMGARIFYDLPKGKKIDFSQEGKYILGKDLAGYQKKKSNGLFELKESDCLTYVFTVRDDHMMGDYITIQGRKFYVYRICSRYVDGEMLHEYHLMQEKGLARPTAWLEQISGCSLDAMVKEVKEDKVQVGILNDENKQQEINVFYPYATVYSTPDGTGWYCMPEPGDMVRLTIPGKREGEAFVTSSVHVETESADRKDPDFKVLKTKYQKEVRFTPNSIVITNNQGTKIELTDGEGIHMVSANAVMLEASEDVTISSDKGSLIVAGTSSVLLKQKGTSITLDKGISFTGGELRVQ